MRLIFLATALVMMGCAHEEELRPAKEPSSDSTFSTKPPSSEVTSAYTSEPPQARPRLSQVVTLGQEEYVPLPASPQTGAPSNGGVNVTVNNNINVAQPPVYYGGYYGGGYGGGYSVGAAPHGAYRGTGWEGAQRTAAPGHTPAVGGNWSPPPSYGPRQMK